MKTKQIGIKKILVLLLLLSILLTACTTTTGTNEEITSDEDVSDEIVEPITIGIMTTGSTTDVFNAGLEVLKREGYEVETTVFNDYNSPNTAVYDGSLQYNFYQHKPFLDAFNESQGTDLVPVGDGVFTISYGVFSNKIGNVEEVKEGMTVAIQNDASNRSVSLQLLENAGLIKLKEGVEIPTLLDVTENPKNLEFIEMEETMIPASYEDVDLACSIASWWKKSEMDLNDAIILGSDEKSVVYLVTTPGNKDSETSRVIQEALTSPEVKNYIEKEYKGIVEPVF